MCPSRTEALTVARGPLQRQFVHDLYDGYTPHSYAYGLRGHAASYVGRYSEHFGALLARLIDLGVPIDRTPGPRGGFHASKYRLREDCHVVE